MTTLKKAREAGQLEDFIREREGQEGDAAALESTLGSMAGANKGKPSKKSDKA